MPPTLELISETGSVELPIRKMWRCQKCGRNLRAFAFTAAVLAAKWYENVIEKETEKKRLEAANAGCDCTD